MSGLWSSSAMGMQAPPMWANGPTPGGLYQLYPQQKSKPEDVRTHTSQPSVTGTSVLAIKFKGGVAIAADTLGSYGSMARFTSVSRLMKVGESTIVGASGDIADFQHIAHVLEQLMIQNAEADDGHALTPKAVHSYLTRILYNRRCEMNPLWNTLVVGGIQNGKTFLASVDKIGVAFESETIGTGYGMHMALPLLRTAYEANPEMTEEEAVAELKKSMEVLFYRDARSWNRYEIGVVTTTASDISAPFSLETNWDIAPMVRGYE